MLYKTDLEVDTATDLEDEFYYVGTEQVDGNTYDKWRKISVSDYDDGLSWTGAGKCFAYTNIVVENNRLIADVISTDVAGSGTMVKIANVPAWKLKYSLDNDITKYAWADETNGKGVIYWLKDEHNNECHYDFKNIQFKRWYIEQ